MPRGKPGMTCLTISQPWADLIARGEKTIENRKWATRYKGPLGIHAGKGDQYLTLDELKGHTTGALVAVAELRGCVHHRTAWEFHNAGRQYQGKHATLTPAQLAELLANPHAEGPWLWLLADVHRLAEPLPMPGKPGLWRAAGVDWQNLSYLT